MRVSSSSARPSSSARSSHSRRMIAIMRPRSSRLIAATRSWALAAAFTASSTVANTPWPMGDLLRSGTAATGAAGRVAPIGGIGIGRRTGAGAPSRGANSRAMTSCAISATTRS